MFISPGVQQTGFSVIRMIVGALLIYHGLEIFDDAIMNGYMQWEVFKKMPAAGFMVHLGKALELFSGICLVLGLLTRFAGLVLAVVMFFICFKVGHGKFWYDDQHPFLLALFGIVFFLYGPGKWALDHILFKQRPS